MKALPKDLARLSKAIRSGKVTIGLRQSIEGRRANRAFPVLTEALIQIDQQLQRSGIIPMRLVCSYWSQGRSEAEKNIQISWVRGDLLLHGDHMSSKTPRSHGPGLRLTIYGDGRIHCGFSTRFDAHAYSNFRSNVLKDQGYIRAAMDSLPQSYWIARDWGHAGDDAPLNGFTDLKRQLKGVKKSRRSYVWIERALAVKQHQSAQTFVRAVHQSILAVVPFFYAHLIPVVPKNAKTHRSMRKQLTREALRRQILRLESQCQRAGFGCQTQKGPSGGLRVAHLLRGINSIENAILLCTHCESLQYPPSTDIQVLPGSSRHHSGGVVRKILVPTRHGNKVWQVLCAPGHSLSRHPKKKGAI